jgi:MFS family permease
MRLFFSLMNYRNNMNGFLSKIYAFKFFDDLIFIYPLYAVMFVDYGLTGLQISIILAVWSITAFILEVPSGVIADKYSRKHILFFAQIARIVGYACWLIFPNFIGFLIGFIFWGVKSAFTSGTFEALVFDELKQANRDSEYTKIIGRARSFAFVAILLASFGASVAIHFGYSFVLAISLVSLTVSSISIIILPKAKRFESTNEKKYFSRLKQGFSDSVRNPLIFKLIIFISISLALGGAIDEYWPIFGEQVGLAKYAIAIFIGASSAIQAIASVIAYKFSHLSNRIFYVAFALNGILLLIASLIFKPATVLFLLVFSFLFKIIDVVFEGEIQNVIPTAQRATILSVKGFFTEIGVTAVYFGVGSLASLYSYRTSFLMFSWLTILVGVGYLLFSFSNKLAVKEQNIDHLSTDSK